MGLGRISSRLGNLEKGSSQQFNHDMTNIFSSRVETPKPNEFSSKRDTKELDNYIWNIK